MKCQTMQKETEWTILNLLKWTTSFFQSHDIDSPRITAEILLAHTLHIQRIDLYLKFDQPLSQEELSAFKLLIKRRVTREPVAYITGSKEFWSKPFTVDRDVLIPRPDTECLVETALRFIPETTGHDCEREAARKRICELGTGSGAVIISIASERPGHCFFASDLSDKAITVAKKNAENHGLGMDIHFFLGSWLQPVNEKKALFDMILSNPPYIASETIGTLQPEINRFEPLKALDGGKDGLDAVQDLICSAHAFLKPKGQLMLEIGYDQKDSVKTIIKRSGCYEDVVFEKDFGGHDRVVRMIKK